MVVSADNSLKEVSECILLQDGHFKSQATDYNKKNVNYSENNLFSVNQGFLIVENGEKVFCRDHCILGQIIEAANILTKVDSMSVVLKRLNILKYDLSASEFLGIYNTVGFIMVRGNDNKTFSSIMDTKKKIINFSTLSKESDSKLFLKEIIQ